MTNKDLCDKEQSDKEQRKKTDTVIIKEDRDFLTVKKILLCEKKIETYEQ
jgi:archaeosine-15-forming tRNA-guanine transglycosylase